MALLGAIARIATGVLTEREAIASVDMPTILLLYALMVVSAQLKLGGFYTWVALGMTRHMLRPARFLLIMMVLSAVLSAILAWAGVTVHDEVVTEVPKAQFEVLNQELGGSVVPFGTSTNTTSPCWPAA